MTVRRLAAVDAQTYWLSAKIPNDTLLLYGFDGVPTNTLPGSTPHGQDECRAGL